MAACEEEEEEEEREQEGDGEEEQKDSWIFTTFSRVARGAQHRYHLLLSIHQPHA